MSWEDFLTQLRGNHVCLVGPLATGVVSPIVPTIYVDGGVAFRADGPALHISVGDGDSARALLDENLPSRKDFSDLAFVLKALPTFVTCLDLHGFLGGRRDHELINFGEVHHRLLRAPGHARFFANSSVQVLAFNGSVSLNLRGTFSVLSFSSGDVHISGDCAYKWNGPMPPVSSLGLSNEAHGIVQLQSKMPCFVFSEAGIEA